MTTVKAMPAVFIFTSLVLVHRTNTVNVVQFDTSATQEVERKDVPGLPAVVHVPSVVGCLAPFCIVWLHNKAFQGHFNC